MIENEKNKVIVIGGGFGGLNVVSTLRKSKKKILLIDKKNHHLFQPLLYQVASAALSPADIATPLREIFRSCKNVTVMMGDVVHIDKNKKEITLKDGAIETYDYLVIGIGARHSYFGKDEWEQFAPGLKTLRDALTIREKVLLSFETAERLDDPKEIEKHLNFVVIGGGPTGVEMAGAIAEIAHKTLFKNFRKIHPEKSKIYLIEGADRVLPPFPKSLSKRAKKDLEKMGVEVITSKIVTNVTAEGIEIGTEKIHAKNIIWAAGNQVSPLLKDLEVERDRQGRIIVEKDLSIPNNPEIFVIGDAAHLESKKGPLPGIAPVAIQMAGYVGRVIKKDIPKEKRRPFRYFDKGSLATIGTGKAVGFMGKLRLTGLVAWLGWGLIHVAYLIGYRNRFTVMLNWIFHYVTGIRGARLVYKSIDEELPKKDISSKK